MAKLATIALSSIITVIVFQLWGLIYHPVMKHRYDFPIMYAIYVLYIKYRWCHYASTSAPQHCTTCLQFDDGTGAAVKVIASQVDGHETLDVPASRPQAEAADQVVREVHTLRPGREPRALHRAHDVVRHAESDYPALANHVVHRLLEKRHVN